MPASGCRRRSSRMDSATGPAQRGEVGLSITPTSVTCNKQSETLKYRDFQAVEKLRSLGFVTDFSNKLQ